MKVGPCSRLFPQMYLVNSFQNLHSGSLPLLRQIFEHVSQTEATDRYFVMIPKYYVQMKHKQIKQLPVSCSHFRTFCACIMCTMPFGCSGRQHLILCLLIWQVVMIQESINLNNALYTMTLMQVTEMWHL